MEEEAGYETSNIYRRDFVKKSLILTASSVTGIGFLSGCKNEAKKETGEGQEVSPPEDLMQEHGLLNRVLLIFDTCKTQLENKMPFPKEALLNSAHIIRSFIEDYHEKQEENYLFPRFKKANRLTNLVDTLLMQHQAGRNITDQVLQLSKIMRPSETDHQKLIRLLTAFNAMYRPHEAREDTVLFPAFRKIVSRHEYDSLGEEFEKNERKLFGEDGFETMVTKVADIEKSIGIYDLAKFTPR